jgi:hypothetical protein
MKILILFLMFNFFYNQVFSQSNFVASGSSNNSPDGSISYSIGQIAYLNTTTSASSIFEGLQMPIEKNLITSVVDILLNINVDVFPNPATEYVFLKIENFNSLKLSYLLLDNSGITLFNNSINEKITKINLASLANGTYTLKIFNKKNNVKFFKIIKSK